MTCYCEIRIVCLLVKDVSDSRLTSTKKKRNSQWKKKNRRSPKYLPVKQQIGTYCCQYYKNENIIMFMFLTRHYTRLRNFFLYLNKLPGQVCKQQKIQLKRCALLTGINYSSHKPTHILHLLHGFKVPETISFHKTCYQPHPNVLPLYFNRNIPLNRLSIKGVAHQVDNPTYTD